MEVQVIADKDISQREIDAVLAEEKKIYAESGKVLGEVELRLDNNEIVVDSYAASPIRRIRRITGYLSDERNFNDAKQAELRYRVSHFPTN